MIREIGSNKNTEMSSDGTMCTHSLTQRAHFCIHERAPRKLAYGTGLDAPEYLGVDFVSVSSMSYQIKLTQHYLLTAITHAGRVTGLPECCQPAG